LCKRTRHVHTYISICGLHFIEVPVHVHIFLTSIFSFIHILICVYVHIHTCLHQKITCTWNKHETHTLAHIFVSSAEKNKWHLLLFLTHASCACVYTHHTHYMCPKTFKTKFLSRIYISVCMCMCDVHLYTHAHTDFDINRSVYIFIE
jgi:hypothetical protein